MANRAGFNPNDKVSKSSKGFDAAISGLLTGTITRSIIQPLDVFKIRYQLQVETRADAKYQNIRRAFVTIFKEEGIAAFWKGHMAAQYLSAIYMTAQFYGVDVFTRQLYSWFPSLNESGVNRTLIMSSGGLFGATMATLISFPFDVVRTRIVAQPTTNLKDPSSLYYTNTRNALIQIVNREGLFGLYKGILPRLLSIGPTSAINFAGYNTFTEIYYYLKQDQLNIAEKFLCGSLSGGVGKTIVYPLDTIQKRLQVQGFEEGRRNLGATQKYNGIWHCMVTMYKNENGLRGFYKGYVPGMAKALLSTGLYFSLFELFKKLIVVQRTEL